MTTFGEFIAKRRKKLDLTQRQIAAGIKQDDGKPLSVQNLNDIEHGRRGGRQITLSCNWPNFCGWGSTGSIFVQGVCRSTSGRGPFLTSERPLPIAPFAEN
jgi:hypothetical protein